MLSKTAKRVLLMGLLAALLGLGGYAGYRSYEKLQQELRVQQARGFLAQSDFKKALLCLSGALRYNPKDLEACRLMAELAETSDPTAALAWRKRVVELNPYALADELALVRTALKARDVATATNTLDKVDLIGKNTPAYLNQAGAVAATLGRFAQAQAYFREASRLEPANPEPLVDIAILRLFQTNAIELEQGRSFLRNFASNSPNASLRRKALLELTADARRYHQTNSALEFSKAVLQLTNSLFEDTLLRLDVLADAGDSELKQTLDAAQRAAVGDPAKIQKLASWQMKRTPPGDLLAWLRSLPAATQTNRVVAVAMAEACCHAQDWRGLQAFLQPQKWADLECVRLAYQARALDGLQSTNAAKTKWADALAAASDRKQSQVMLVQLAAEWHWSSEKEKLLMDIVNHHPEEKWALRDLTQILFESGRTWPLLELLGHASEQDPSELTLKNKVALLALLLNAEAWKPRELAREVYQKAPTNSAFASTYAFSLHLQKKDAEARKVLDRLPPGDLVIPSIAADYGLVLEATGDRDKARKYLEIASKAPMLPEQRKLIEQARADL